MAQSDSNRAVDGTVTPPTRTSAELATAMAVAVASGNVEATRSLVREAQTEHPGDPDLVVPLAKCTTVLSRAKWLDDALEAIQRDLEEDHFCAALGHFREALCLARGFPALKAMADADANQQSRKLLPHNWRVAEALLQEAAAAEPFFVPDADLENQFQLARHQEMISSSIHKADRAEFDGTLNEARRRLKDLLAAYPHEQRLAERLRALDIRAESIVTSSSSPGKPEIRSGAPLSVYTPGEATLAAKPRQTGVLTENFDWASIKNFASLAAATAMLGVAGFLVWHHFSSTPQTANALRTVTHQGSAANSQSPGQNATALPAMPERQAATEEQAWQLVRSSDNETSIRTFLTAYPSSPHALRARFRLAAIEWGMVDKSNADSVQTYLRLHPRSPYKPEAEQLLRDLVPKNPTAPPVAALGASAVPSDREAILDAVRGYLDAQPNFTQQSSSDIIDEPVVDGEEATIQLHLKSAEAAPALTFSLSKTAGVWKVQRVR